MGYKAEDDKEYKECPICHGSGRVSTLVRKGGIESFGTEKREMIACDACSGSGRVRK